MRFQLVLEDRLDQLWALDAEAADFLPADAHGLDGVLCATHALSYAAAAPAGDFRLSKTLTQTNVHCGCPRRLVCANPNA